MDLNKYILYTKTNRIKFYMSSECIDCNNAGIYKITNYNNGKIYIGSSKKIFNRLKEHVRYMQQGLCNSKFNKDIENGDNIYIAEIVDLPKHINYYRLIELERYYIKKYRPFYNIAIPHANRESDFRALKRFQNAILSNKELKHTRDNYFTSLKTLRMRLEILNP